MYQGEDLIIVTGAPGSRWSGVIRLLSLICKEINITSHVDIQDPSIYDGSRYYDWLSLAYHGSGDYENAIKKIDKCIALAPRNNRYKENKELYKRNLQKIKT